MARDCGRRVDTLLIEIDRVKITGVTTLRLGRILIQTWDFQTRRRNHSLIEAYSRPNCYPLPYHSRAPRHYQENQEHDSD